MTHPASQAGFTPPQSALPELAELERRLRQHGQQSLLRFANQLDVRRLAKLVEQIQSIDFAAIDRLKAGQDQSIDWHDLAASARSPRAIRLEQPDFAEQSRHAAAAGEAALRGGQLRVILVAGGQGTRLGFDRPKGLLPLGVLSDRTLFQILVDRLRAVARRYRAALPLFVMTSDATHDETVAYFQQQQHLGLDADNVHFFRQGNMPAVDAATVQVLLSQIDRVALSPDGHGGMLRAFERSGLLAEVRRRGIQHLFYCQVDNPLCQVCDPVLIGHHLRAASEMTTQVVQKRDPFERVGNVVDVNGRTQIIEYSDLPPRDAQRRKPDGSLELWAGNLAIHVFATAFLERAAADVQSLPFHRATKIVDTVTQHGQPWSPDQPNAIKFERFIFDLLPLARNALVVEADPARAFAPVKNAPPAATDTVATARAAMIAHDRRLLAEAGCALAADVHVEVNPLWALDADEARQRLAEQPTPRIERPTYFT